MDFINNEIKENDEKKYRIYQCPKCQKKVITKKKYPYNEYVPVTISPEPYPIAQQLPDRTI